MPESLGHPHRQKQGLILLYVFLIVLVILSLALVALQGNLTDHRLVTNTHLEIQARWLAFGGIAKGLQKLDLEPDFRGTLPDEPFKTGVVQVTIKDLEGGKLLIEAIGTAGTLRVRAEKVLQ